MIIIWRGVAGIGVGVGVGSRFFLGRWLWLYVNVCARIIVDHNVFVDPDMFFLLLNVLIGRFSDGNQIFGPEW